MGLSGAKFSNNCTQVINAFPTNSRSLWRTVGRNTSNKMARFVPNFDEFDSLTLFGICRQFTENIPDTIAWCWRNGLLVRRLLCENCHVECIEGALNKSLDGVTWRCPQCRKKNFNGRKGSFFEGSKLQLWQIIALTYFWSLDCGRDQGLSQKQILKELDIKSEHTVVDWKQFCRDVCVEQFLNNPQQIGGPGRIVKIDESLFSRRKYGGRQKRVPDSSSAKGCRDPITNPSNEGSAWLNCLFGHVAGIQSSREHRLSTSDCEPHLQFCRPSHLDHYKSCRSDVTAGKE